jgi:pimeloyl-ACP methyl ester carboxylesterase
MSGPEATLVSLPDGVLEAEVRGSGEPVVLVQTALFAEEFRPLADQPDLRDRFQVVLYHRRGYGGSSPARRPGSIERDALDCELLLDALGIARAHVLGGSYSGAVALQLAATAPGRVHSLCLLEPPPLQTPSAGDFRAACERLVEDYHREGARTAVERFLSELVGADWRSVLERDLPGGLERVGRDADTFFAADLPALLSWSFREEQARGIRQPVLHVGGSDSGPWFSEVRELVLDWLPQAHDVVVGGADHSLALTHAPEVAAAVGRFLRRHPIGT